MAQLTSRFTPSLLDEETLNRLFVHRHDLVEDAAGRMQRTAITDERAHRLFIGPRGAGKTHLISLIFHAARKLQDAEARLQVAWLAEDPWGIDSYEDLLTEILERIGLPDAEAPEEELLHAVETGGPIVVLLENLDQIFDSIGDDGRRRLRALLENRRPLLLIATSTRLTAELKDQTASFYGFFDTTQLKPFDVDEATAMLQAIARVQEDEALAYRLDQPSARARLAAVRHLAGGQPRVWALLGTGLTAEALDDLVDVLMQKFDDLTPYYQEQLARLSGNERKVVRRLADSGRAMTVRELAEATKIDQKSLARTATDLRRKGWIHPRTGLLMQHIDKRLTYYELSEPLVRLAFQLKASRGEPVKLVVEFLGAWFELKELSTASPRSPLALRYASEALELVHAPGARVGHRLAARVRAAPIAGSARDSSGRWWHGEDDAEIASTLESLDDALQSYLTGDATAILVHETSLSHLIEHRLATSTVSQVRLELALIAIENSHPSEWIERADSLAADATRAEKPVALLIAAICRLSAGQSAAAYIDRAVQCLSDEKTPRPTLDLAGLTDRLARMGLHDEAMRICDAAIAHSDQALQLPLLEIQAGLDLENSQPQKSVERWTEYLKNVDSGAQPRRWLVARTGLCLAHSENHQLDEAIRGLIDIIAMAEEHLGPDDITTLICRDNLATLLRKDGRTSDALALVESVYDSFDRALGRFHPDTLTARNNLSLALHDAGRVEEALGQLEIVLQDTAAVLGYEHPNTLSVLNNLGSMYASRGNSKKAIELLESAVAGRERTLGRHHPDTLLSERNLSVVRT